MGLAWRRRPPARDAARRAVTQLLELELEFDELFEDPLEELFDELFEDPLEELLDEPLEDRLEELLDEPFELRLELEFELELEAPLLERLEPEAAAPLLELLDELLLELFDDPFDDPLDELLELELPALNFNGLPPSSACKAMRPMASSGSVSVCAWACAPEVATRPATVVAIMRCFVSMKKLLSGWWVRSARWPTGAGAACRVCRDNAARADSFPPGL